MANVYAVKSGNWSDTTLWNTGSLPATIDDVYANNFIVNVDGNYQTTLVTNNSAAGITLGGHFRMNNQASLSANVLGCVNDVACVQFLSASPNTCTIVGNLCAFNPAANFPLIIRNNNTGIMTLSGTFLRFINNGTNNTISSRYPINNATTGTLNVFGNYIPRSNADFTGVISLLNNFGTINFVGNLEIFASNCIGINNSGTVNLTGNCFGDGNTGIAHSAGTVNVFGTIRGGAVGHGIALAASVGTAFVNVSGAVIGGFGGDGIRQSSSGGVINVRGTVIGGSGANGEGISMVTANTTVSVTGTVIGGTAGPGIINGSTGTATVSGTVIGGPVASVYGFSNLSTGTAIISGSAIGGLGSGAHGAFNSSTGVLRVQRAVGNDWGLGYTTALGPAAGVASGVAGSQTFVQELQTGPRGQWPTAGIIFFTPNTKATSMFETDTFQNYSLIQSNSADNLLPPVSSVRQGTIYDLGMDTGTCAIPPASSVGLGVPVDNTTGIATLTPTNVWNISASQITDNQSIGGRLKNTLSTNAAQNLLNSFNS
jgi:hypothetical protein